MSAVPALAVDGVWKFFGDFPALRDLRCELPAGASLALLGRNGAGKTTLLRILAGLSAPSKGAVRLFGTAPREKETRARIGIIGHGIAVYDEMSAIENLRIYARLYAIPDAERRCAEWLERVELAHVQHGLAREFSRGMRQRLAIARAFLHDPKLLILDEPFTGLDDRSIALLQRLLREALGRGATAIMSTHQLREALELCSHVSLLNRGKLAFFGERPAEMLDDPAWIYRTYGEAA